EPRLDELFATVCPEGAAPVFESLSNIALGPAGAVCHHAARGGPWPRRVVVGRRHGLSPGSGFGQPVAPHRSHRNGASPRTALPLGITISIRLRQAGACEVPEPARPAS